MTLKLLSGNDLGVPRNENYLVVESENPRIVFSYAQKGQAITLHFACPPESLRDLRNGLNQFCDWLFYAYPWCRMIFGFINKPSVERMVVKIGFDKLMEIDEGAIYIRLRDDNQRPVVLEEKNYVVYH